MDNGLEWSNQASIPMEDNRTMEDQTFNSNQIPRELMDNNLNHPSIHTNQPEHEKESTSYNSTGTQDHQNISEDVPTLPKQTSPHNEDQLSDTTLSDPSTTNSNHPIPMDSDDNNNQNTKSHSDHSEKQISTTNDYIDKQNNNSNPSTTEQLKPEFIPNQEEKNEPTPDQGQTTNIDDIKISLDENVDPQPMDIQKEHIDENQPTISTNTSDNHQKGINNSNEISFPNVPDDKIDLQENAETNQPLTPPVIPPIEDDNVNREENICSVYAPQKTNENSTSNSQLESLDRTWLNLQFHDQDRQQIKKPNEIEKNMSVPSTSIESGILNRIEGSIIGMALGDALGAHVEFRPHAYLKTNPVKDLQGGGTWGLQKGQFTDDTSMALCLANSLISSQGFNPYDQLVRYKWWFRHGYMSSTGQCFDIGSATRQSIAEFEDRQKGLTDTNGNNINDIDSPSIPQRVDKFDVYCSGDGVAGNGALMRLAPVPLFFHRYPSDAVEYSGISGQITHGDTKAYDACRYYGALIVAALQGDTKEQLLDVEFYSKHESWFGQNELHPDILKIAKGSYQNSKGYDGGIRGKGYIVDALEAALWAFWSDGNSFETGALNAVNLGDDTDTTAAIYGQLAGAHYGYNQLPSKWVKQVYAKIFLEKLSHWIAYEGQRWKKGQTTPNDDSQ